MPSRLFPDTNRSQFQWLDAKKFDCPANTDNQCIEPQKTGFSWEGLNLGKFTNFGDFDFDGFECADSFDGKVKRDQITGRTFQVCICNASFSLQVLISA